MAMPGWMGGLACALVMLAACGSDPAHVALLPDSGEPATDAAVQDAATSEADAEVPADADHDAAEPPPDADVDPVLCVDTLDLPLLSEAPGTLAETGLYLTGSAAPVEFAPYARPFQPQFQLWSDGASKQRFVYLPACTQIDTSSMDYWKFPVGTRFWKEFSKGGKLLETRFIHRFGPREQDWLFATYQWDLANLTPERALRVHDDGARNVNGTQHDIPAQRQCRECHVNLPEPPLSFAAIQLSHALPGETLRSLSREGWLTVPATRDYPPPGDADARAGLGYLHANCGHCHNSYYRTLGSSLGNDPAPRMWLSVNDRSIESTRLYDTLLGVQTYNPAYEGYNRIEPCTPQLSSVVLRMITRTDDQMPPIATEFVHMEGVEVVSRFLRTLRAPGMTTCPSIVTP